MQPWLESTRAGLRYRTSGKCGYETIEAIPNSFEETQRILWQQQNLCLQQTLLFVLSSLLAVNWILRTHKKTDVV